MVQDYAACKWDWLTLRTLIELKNPSDYRLNCCQSLKEQIDVECVKHLRISGTAILL